MKNTREDVDLLLPSAAARELGCSAAAVRLWIRQGRLPALRLSGGVRAIRLEDLRRFAADRRPETEADDARG